MIGFVRHHRWLKRLMTDVGCRLPKRSTIFGVLLFERFTRGARLRASCFPLSRQHRQDLGDLFSRSYALLVLLAYDDPFERQGECELGRRYDYLMRALRGFLAGFHTELLSVSDFLFPEASSPSDRQRNVPIVAAIELGRTLRRLQGVLREVGLPESLLREQERAIEIRLLKAAHAQAHTVEQHDVDQLGWRRYCQLSLWKTNSMIEIGAFIRGILGADALRFRLGCHRFCEQIYLDDLYDIVEDTKAGIAGAAHVLLREQGILAAQVLPALSGERSSARVDAVGDALATSGLLERSSEGAFLQANPLWMPRTADGSSNGEWRSPLYEALVNDRWEAGLPLEELLHRRRRAWEDLRNAWRARDHRQVLRVLHLSGVPLRLVRGFLRHLRDIRHDYLPGGRPGLSGVGHFLFLQIAARLLLVRLWLACRHASVVSAIVAARRVAHAAAQTLSGAALASSCLVLRKRLFGSQRRLSAARRGRLSP